MIFFDFDGTLIDLWPRYYSVFISLTGKHDLSFSYYKWAKQKFQKDIDIASVLGTKLPENYFELKKELLEDKKYLDMDKPFFNVNIINSFFARSNACILTKRRNISNFKWQLNLLNIKCNYFVVENIEKRNWIEQNYPNEQCVIIGDSTEDLKAAELDNVEAYLVGYGLNTKSQFDECRLKYTFIETPKELLDIFVGEINAVP